MLNKNNIILRADSYKYSHFKLFPKGVTNNYSYVEARKVDEDFPHTEDMVFFGLQAYIKEYLVTPITKRDVEEAQELIEAHGLPFNYNDWMTIVNEYDGYLPLLIHALPEGSVAKIGEPLCQVQATDDRFAWLASFVETSMLRSIWYPSTVATLSRSVKKNIKMFLDYTTDDTEAELGFKLHDFGARGVSSAESAMLGGLGHLVNFMGTDTVEALVGAKRYYDADGPVGFSIPASEHSTITSWGKDGEFDAFSNMVDQYADAPIMACVSDSYNIYEACADKWPRLKDKLERNGTMLVVRPDSGDPVQVVSDIIEILGSNFGYSVNSKCFKVLDGVRIIQGDGVNPDSIYKILSNLKNAGWSASNIAFGMGGALLQKVNRDSLGFAQKTCAICIGDGDLVDVYKQPVGSEFKKSKAGIQWNPKWEVKFNTGVIKNCQTFDEVRKNAEVS